MDVTAMGKVGLTGWRGRLGSKVAGPVAERTRLSRDQVEAMIGALFLALAAWQFAKLLSRLVRAGRGQELELAA